MLPHDQRDLAAPPRGLPRLTSTVLNKPRRQAQDADVAQVCHRAVKGGNARLGERNILGRLATSVVDLRIGASGLGRVALDEVPVQDQPPVNVVRFAFQTMVGIGTLLALLGVVYL
jgi:cytochrome bd-type quinol oxidase subunit 1